MPTINIVKGEDRVLVMRVVDEKTQEPFDLTGYTKITAQFKKSNNTLLELTSNPVGGVAASIQYEGVTFTADNVGNDGNSITLVFNGSDDVATVVAAWNGANLTNQVSHDGIGSEVLTADTISLTGGVDAVIAVSVLGNSLLGKVQTLLSDTDTNSMRLGKNQTVRLIIDKGEHPNGDRRIALFRDAINVVSAEF